jgi:hypothetical protein
MQLPSGDTLIILFLVGTVLLTLGLTYWRNQRLKAVFEEQAAKRGGRVEGGSFLYTPQLYLPVNAREVRIFCFPGSRNRPAKTTAEITSTSAAEFPKIKIGRNNLFQKALTAFGRERWLSGDEEFDQNFTVQGEDEASLRRLLTPPNQRNLLEWAGKNPSLEIGPGTFKLTILRMLKQPEEYDQFIEMASALLRALEGSF